MTISDTRAPDNRQQPVISVVIPVFNEEGSLKTLYESLTAQLEDLGKSFEIVFVDDGSAAMHQIRVALAAHGIEVLELRRTPPRMEEAFISLIRRRQSEEAKATAGQG